jgi:hypothetical protein
MGTSMQNAHGPGEQLQTSLLDMGAEHYEVIYHP